MLVVIVPKLSRMRWPNDSGLKALYKYTAPRWMHVCCTCLKGVAVNLMRKGILGNSGFPCLQAESSVNAQRLGDPCNVYVFVLFYLWIRSWSYCHACAMRTACLVCNTAHTHMLCMLHHNASVTVPKVGPMFAYR